MLIATAPNNGVATGTGIIRNFYFVKTVDG